MMIAYLFIIFIAILLSAVVILLILGWVITKNIIFAKLIGAVVLGVVGVILMLSVIRLFTSKKELTRSDIYGTYIIDRTKFSSKQADWQYNHYRFEITRQNEFLFQLTEKEKVTKTYHGKAIFVPNYKIPRIVLQVDSPLYHIINKEPTLYRTAWSFYYVFRSPKFGNVFFKKSKWKPILQP